MFPLLVFALLVVPQAASAQSPKANDNAARNKLLGIQQETRTLITYTNWGEPVDTCQLAVLEFNKSGFVTHATEYKSCGEPFAKHEFYYDGRGRMTGGAVGYVTDHCTMVFVEVVLDDKGRVIERALTSSVPELWAKETYTYDDYGVLTSLTQWAEKDGKMKSTHHQEHPGAVEQLQQDSNAKTHLRDDRGLLREKRVYEKKTVVEKVLYSYEYY